MIRSARAVTGLVLAVLALGPARAADAPERIVRYADDALTVRLTRAPVDEVLAEIGHQAGAEIQGHTTEPREISADFEAVPLPDALHRLLGSQNFALVYGDGKLKTVKLLGAASAASATVTAARPATATTLPDGEIPPAEFGSVYLATPVSLPPGSPLARVLENPTTVKRVVDVGLRNPDAAVRAEAVRLALKMAEGKPDLRRAMIDGMGGMDDITLTGMLQGAAGENAAEIAEIVSREARTFQLREKASAVLRTLQGGD